MRTYTRTCHSHIHPTEIAQKTYVTLLIAPNHRYDNDVSLLTLEAIDSIHRYAASERLEERRVLYQMTEIPHLCAIR